MYNLKHKKNESNFCDIISKKKDLLISYLYANGLLPINLIVSIMKMFQDFYGNFAEKLQLMISDEMNEKCVSRL